MKIEEILSEYGCLELSQGTLRPQDTIPPMLQLLSIMNPTGFSQCMEPASGFQLVPDYAIQDPDEPWWFENGQGLVSVLMDALNECAPDGYYFGSAEGDGASIGYWKCE